jgi:hypothetical protein
MRERIEAAAVRHKGAVWTLPRPARHHHILWAIDHVHPGGDVVGPDEQGFVTDAGRFVERADAMMIARAAGQTTSTHFHLFSEDLW